MAIGIYEIEESEDDRILNLKHYYAKNRKKNKKNNFFNHLMKICDNHRVLNIKLGTDE